MPKLTEDALKNLMTRIQRDNPQDYDSLRGHISGLLDEVFKTAILNSERRDEKMGQCQAYLKLQGMLELPFIEGPRGEEGNPFQ